MLITLYTNIVVNTTPLILNEIVKTCCPLNKGDLYLLDA